MENLTHEQMTAWRNFATTALNKQGIEVFDPCRREPFHSGEQSRNTARRIVKLDFQDISKSSVVLANLKDLYGGRAWGTVAEIAHAYTKNKIIIVIAEPDFHHPFIEFYATEIHFTVEEAVNATAYYF